VLECGGLRAEDVLLMGDDIARLNVGIGSYSTSNVLVGGGGGRRDEVNQRK
jgi:hypothetical protein